MRSFFSGVILILISGMANGATPEAWDEYAQNLEVQCRALVSQGERKLNNVNALVDRYNKIVLLIGTDELIGLEMVVACFYDSTEESVKLSDGFPVQKIVPDYKD